MNDSTVCARRGHEFVHMRDQGIMEPMRCLDCGEVEVIEWPKDDPTPVQRGTAT